ncbi:MAG: hypothetical protein IKO55_11080 [Kiritimatiellae bacterium]|nr:hypothetical protein [Kiritimatiellia bacterium]
MNTFESLVADFAKMTGLPPRCRRDAGGGEGGRSDGGAADGVPNGELSGFMRV